MTPASTGQPSQKDWCYHGTAPEGQVHSPAATWLLARLAQLQPLVSGQPKPTSGATFFLMGTHTH